ETILRGEKPAGWNYRIRGGCYGLAGNDLSYEYYVHWEAFARINEVLRVDWGLCGLPTEYSKRVVRTALDRAGVELIHLNIRTFVFQFLLDSVLPCFPDSGIKAAHVPLIMDSLMTHLHKVSSVHKCAAVDFSSGNGVKKEEKAVEVKKILLDVETEDVNVHIPNE
ncbi:hypothetical protein PENTCL1PPCAC_13833, partial [Pristionchus entomophagus]